MAAASNGHGIDIWMFQFIRHDPAFQGVLFRTAEDAHNWKFLENLSDYRAEQRRAALPPVTPPIQRRSEFRRPPPRPQRRFKPQRAVPPRGRQKLRLRPPTPSPLDPKTLPPERVMRVSSRAFTHCPRCKLRLLAKVLTDHLELSCPHRGRVDGASGSPPWSGPSYDGHWSPW